MNFHSVFNASPNPYLILDRRLHIVGANQAYLANVKRDLADIVGRWAWDAFPADEETVRQSVASFERVIRTKQPDTMALLRFDVPRPEAEGGGFMKRYWSITHSPVLGDDGEVEAVLQHPIDVTPLQHLQGAIERSGLASTLGISPDQSGIFERAQSVFENNLVLKAESERLNEMFAQAPSFMALLRGPEHRIEMANPAYLTLVGDRPVLGRTVMQALPDAVEQGYLTILDMVFHEGEAYRADAAVYAVRSEPGGPVNERLLDFVLQPIRDQNGKIAGIFVEGTDVTARAMAFAALRESEARLRLVVEGARDHAILTITAEGIISSWSAGAETIFGWTEKEIVGQPYGTIFTDEDRAEGADWSELSVAAHEGTAPDERWHACKDGGRVYMSGSVHPLPSRAGESPSFLKVARDDTRRRRAEARRAALARLSDRIHDLTEARDIAYAAAQVIGEVLSVRRVGYSTVDLIAETMLTERDWTAPGVASVAGSLRLRDFGQVIDVLKRGEFMAIPDVAVDAQTGAAKEAFIARDARSLVNVPILERGELVAVFFINDANVRHWSAEDLALIREAAQRTRTAVERARSEAALRESARRLEESARQLQLANETLEARVEERTAERDLMWATSPDLLLILNFEGMFLRVNPTWTTLLGYTPEELVGHHVNEFVVPDDHGETTDAYKLAAQGGQPRIENRYRHKDGSTRWISWVAAPVREVTYATGRDITAEKEREAEFAKAQESLRQSQKMEAVGQLTGGLAHDFNNLLTGVTGSLELMQTRIAQGRIKDVDRYVNAAQGAAKRAAALTHRLLAFSRRQTLDPKPTDVNRLVDGMEELIRRTVGPEITVQPLVSATGLWSTLVDPGQLENALLNLCINARDAMPDGGKITIETGNRWMDERAARERDLPPGQYISLCVSDTGTGMPSDVIAKAFDPFFTTKPIGQGTGLGLSMVYGFARQSGGQVRIYSEVRQGTMVCIYLPRYLGQEEEVETAPDLADAPRAEQGETVLVVDDEPTVRMLVTEVLEDLGYAAIEAADGASGLQVLQSDVRIDLLVTDVGLPGGMNGRQVADAARVARPGLKVLFITGYAENAVLSHGHLDPGMHVLTKPFTMEALASRIRDLISG
ncbi:PAS domain S-box protein [Muricoccus aerilatus]|uniref:PAS domain S-box protein n=1 Tax=Muricoccus aerilatus TaxID=452982 RepID=UPI000ADBF9B9|nr:PAS domain S-box protein [Roseomonas aerilata]